MHACMHFDLRKQTHVSSKPFLCQIDKKQLCFHIVGDRT